MLTSFVLREKHNNGTSSNTSSFLLKGKSLHLACFCVLLTDAPLLGQFGCVLTERTLYMCDRFSTTGLGIQVECLFPGYERPVIDGESTHSQLCFVLCKPSWGQ